MSGGLPSAARSLAGLARSVSGLAENRLGLLVSILIGLGVTLRLILIWTTTSPTVPYNLLYPGYGDGARYASIAHSLLETSTFGYAGRATAFRSPAYPALLALTWKAFGPTLTPIRLLQVGMFVLMTVVYSRVVATRFGKTAAALTTVILSVYPMFVFLSTEIATESLYMLTESCAFALTLAVLQPGQSRTGRAWMSFGAGLCCGAGGLTRPNMFAIFLVAAGLILWSGMDREAPTRWVVPVLALVLGNYAVLGPWLIRNQRTIGAASLATNIDYNFFRGTFDVAGIGATESLLVAKFREHDVMYEGDIEDPGRAGLPYDEVSNERQARAAALAIIRADPARWFRDRLQNAAYLWLNLQWVDDYLANPFVRVSSASVTVFYYLLLLAAAYGFVQFRRKQFDPGQRRFVVTAWLFILAVMPVVLTIVGKRYRVAMIDPFLAMLASVTVAAWLNRTGARMKPANPAARRVSSDRIPDGSGYAGS